MNNFIFFNSGIRNRRQSFRINFDFPRRCFQRVCLWIFTECAESDVVFFRAFFLKIGRFHLLVVGHLRVTFLRFRMEIFDPFVLTAAFSKGLINVWS